MGKARAFGLWVFSCLLGSWLFACGGSKPPQCDKSETVALRFEPHPQLNQDREGYARSVVVRLYQLEAPDAFDVAGFDDIWATGGGAVAAPDELTLVPGRSVSRRLKRNPKAGYLGFVANFRERPGMDWKAVVQLPPPGDPCAEDAKPVAIKLAVQLANYTLQLR